jgi:hypothetical protein
MLWGACLIAFQSGLHAEPVEIDRKLHPIIAGRKRQVLQKIQEETATNIYMPSPLQGYVGPDVLAKASPQVASSVSPNVIWITGEFFGVQRARDMLYSVSVTKVSIASYREHRLAASPLTDILSVKNYHFARYGNLAA